MKNRKTSLAIIVLCGVLFAELGFGQESGGSEPKFLTIGDISKIDLKTKSITLKDATSYNIAQLSSAGGTSGVPGGRANSGATAGGGGGRRTGGRGGGGGRSVASTGRGASAPIPMEYKVVVSSGTVLMEDNGDIKIEDLKIGDRLQVFSMKGGTKVDALKIIRTTKSDS